MSGQRARRVPHHSPRPRRRSRCQSGTAPTPACRAGSNIAIDVAGHPGVGKIDNRIKRRARRSAGTRLAGTARSIARIFDVDRTVPILRCHRVHALFPNEAAPLRLGAGGLLALDVKITRLRRVGKNQAEKIALNPSSTGLEDRISIATPHNNNPYAPSWRSSSTFASITPAAEPVRPHHAVAGNDGGDRVGAAGLAPPTTRRRSPKISTPSPTQGSWSSPPTWG
jgi:hypothetical protein